MKVMTIVGTRPEIIRLSRVIARLDATDGIEHVLVHTGQNYDHNLNAVFFHDLGLRQPDHLLGVDTSSLGAVLGGVLVGTERVLLAEQPDAVLVLGDTNSCLAAVMAKRLQIPTYHMEAGNRCFDENVPEETNRRLVDHVADFNLAYTENARSNLLAEGLHPRRVVVTGSPMREVLNAYQRRIDESDVVERLGLSPRGYFLVSAHRAENVDSPRRLQNLLDGLQHVGEQYDMPVVVSTHPRTRARIEALQHGPSPDSGLRFLAPFGFHDYNQLQKQSMCVLSDSGTISEESIMLGFKAVTLRNSIERPEAFDAGRVILGDVEDPRALAQAVSFAVSSTASAVPDAYAVDDVSERVVGFIVSTAGQNATWHGLRDAD